MALMNWMSQMEASTASRLRSSVFNEQRRPHGASRLQSEETPMAFGDPRREM